MSLTHQQMAADIAPRLDALIDAFLLDMKKPKKRRELREFLWDNKVGILRVLQWAALKD